MDARALTRGRRLAGLSAVVALLLSGCSGGTEPEADGSATPTGGSSETSYLPVPDGVELTDQGTELSVGDKATVAYEPRQDTVGVLEIRVTRLEKASFKMFVGWKLTPETKTNTPYFVHATVTNVGDTDLGGRRVPLYAVDGDNKLIESSTFQSTFKPCPSDDFPETFKNGDKTKACLVYLAPDRGDLAAVSFRPTEEFDPIVWTGEVVSATSGDGKKDRKGDRKKKRGGKKSR